MEVAVVVHAYWHVVLSFFLILVILVKWFLDVVLPGSTLYFMGIIKGTYTTLASLNFLSIPFTGKLGICPASSIPLALLCLWEWDFLLLTEVTLLLVIPSHLCRTVHKILFEDFFLSLPEIFPNMNGFTLPIAPILPAPYAPLTAPAPACFLSFCSQKNASCWLLISHQLPNPW